MEKLTKFTKVPNYILEKIIHNEFTAMETRVLIFLIRNTLGWQKHTPTKFTNKEVAEETKIHPSHLPKLRKSLIEKRVICGGPKDGYLLNLTGSSEKKVAKSDVPFKKGVSSSANKTLSESDTPKCKQRQSYSRKDPVLKKEEINTNNKILSKSIILCDYFKGLKAPLKFQSEKRAFLSLIEAGFSVKEIEAAYQIFMTKGMVGRNGEKPHSPISYIAKVIGDEPVQKAIKSYLGFQTAKLERKLKPVEEKLKPKCQEDEKLESALKEFEIELKSPKAAPVNKVEITKRGFEISKERFGFELKSFMTEAAFNLGVLDWFENRSAFAAAV